MDKRLNILLSLFMTMLFILGAPATAYQQVFHDNYKFTTEITSDFFYEQVKVVAGKGTKAVIFADFYGGTVALPGTETDGISQANTLVFFGSDQEKYRLHFLRRPWLVPDGMYLYVKYVGMAASEADDLAMDAADVFSTNLNITLYLVATHHTGQLHEYAFQAIPPVLDKQKEIINDHVLNSPDDGFIKLFTADDILDADVKVIGFGFVTDEEGNKIGVRRIIKSADAIEDLGDDTFKL